MTRSTKQAAAAEQDAKPRTIPELIKLYNDTDRKIKLLSAEQNICKEPLKTFGQKYGKEITPTQVRAQRTVEAHVCIVHLNLATDYEPDVAAVIKTIGLERCLELGLLSVKVKPLRELAKAEQRPLKGLGRYGEPTVKIGKCEAIAIDS